MSYEFMFTRWTLVSVGIFVGFAYWYNNQQKYKGITNPIRQHILFGDMRRSAVIIGGTGATGTSLVEQLLHSMEWGKITMISRRLLDTSNMKLNKEELSKLNQYIVNMDNLLNDDDIIKLFNNHDITFCTLGTTRDIAKTAENWIKIDVEMVKNAAIASKKANIKQFNLLTSNGANANIWANHWKIFHPLLYMRSKGQIENEIINMSFHRTSIFRPGLLNRGIRARWNEKIFYYLIKSTLVQDVAKAMIYDAESNTVHPNKAEKVVIYQEKDIQFLAKL